ncbi:hypothetical protein APHAL10511_008690, partial [Amanita phalloides]
MPCVIHHKLWREYEFFGNIFHTTNLTKGDFEELQDLLDLENPGHTSDSYVAGDILANKSDFLCKKSKPLKTDFGNSLVPQLVFYATQPQPSGVVSNDAASDDDDDDDGNDAIDIDSYADSHIDHLSNEAMAIFPYTIQYVDLTALNLKEGLH